MFVLCPTCCSYFSYCCGSCFCTNCICSCHISLLTVAAASAAADGTLVVIAAVADFVACCCCVLCCCHSFNAFSIVEVVSVFVSVKLAIIAAALVSQ